MDQALQDISSSAASSVRVERDEFGGKLNFSIDRAQRSLIEQQHAEGYWHAALEANAQMNAEYIIFMHFMETVDKELEGSPEEGTPRSAKRRWQLVDLSRRRRLSLHQHRILLCAEAVRHARRRRADDAGAALDSLQGRHREVRHAGAFLPRVHGPGAVGSDCLSADRDHAVPELVFLQYVRTRLVGARNRIRADAAAGDEAGRAGRLSRRRARALHPAAALHQVQAATAAEVFLAAHVVQFH